MKLGAIFALIFLAVSATGQVKVHGYTRKDGTMVSEYTRGKPSRKYVDTTGGFATNLSKDDYSVPRSSRTKVKRSQSARQQFLNQVPCPATGQTGKPCRGYVVDHIRPLACGGADDPSNMQFQTVADGKAKDKWERKTCGK